MQLISYNDDLEAIHHLSRENKINLSQFTLPCISEGDVVQEDKRNNARLAEKQGVDLEYLKSCGYTYEDGVIKNSEGEVLNGKK